MSGGAVPKIIDINGMLEQYAFAHFVDLESVRKHKSEFRGIEQDDIEFEINLKHLHVLHDEPDYCNLNPTSAKPYTLFKSVFKNNTARPQEYSFKTERSTESVCLHFKEQGYSLGQEAEFALKTPGEIMEFKAGFKHELNFNKGNENSIAEMLTWGVDSNIVVPPRFQTTAELIVEEMSYAGSYTLQTRLAGRVTVTLIRRKDGQVIMPLTANICEVFRDWIEKSSVPRDQKTMVTIEKNSVRLMTKGTCSFQFAMKQKVDLQEEALDGASSYSFANTSPPSTGHYPRYGLNKIIN